MCRHGATDFERCPLANVSSIGRVGLFTNHIKSKILMGFRLLLTSDGLDGVFRFCYFVFLLLWRGM